MHQHMAAHQCWRAPELLVLLLPWTCQRYPWHNAGNTPGCHFSKLSLKQSKCDYRGTPIVQLDQAVPLPNSRLAAAMNCSGAQWRRRLDWKIACNSCINSVMNRAKTCLVQCVI
jgi:hypothetical protein